MKFVGLVGSNYDQSYNRKLLEFIRRQFKIKFELEVLEIDEVPMFNQDEKWDESFQLRLLYNKITRADGVIIATPEHNHTISAALKSVLEWLSFEVHPFENKPVMIVGPTMIKGHHVLRFTSARSLMLQASMLILFQVMNSFLEKQKKLLTKMAISSTKEPLNSSKPAWIIL